MLGDHAIQKRDALYYNCQEGPFHREVLTPMKSMFMYQYSRIPFFPPTAFLWCNKLGIIHTIDVVEFQLGIDIFFF